MSLVLPLCPVDAFVLLLCHIHWYFGFFVANKFKFEFEFWPPPPVGVTANRLVATVGTAVSVIVLCWLTADVDRVGWDTSWTEPSGRSLSSTLHHRAALTRTASTWCPAPPTRASVDRSSVGSENWRRSETRSWKTLSIKRLIFGGDRGVLWPQTDDSDLVDADEKVWHFRPTSGETWQSGTKLPGFNLP